MKRRAAAFALAALAACGDPAITVAPIYDLPVDDPTALPSGLDRLTLSVALAGADQELTSVSFAPGAQVELTGVPLDERVVVHLTGFVAGGDVAYGRTCAFSVGADDPAGPPAPHLWFARTVKFGTVGAAPSARRGGAALTTHDGRAIIVGGDDAATAGAVEAFDPLAASLAPVVALAPRAGAIAAALGLGTAEQVVVVGGQAAGTGVPAIELITLDPPGVEHLPDEPALARVDSTATTLTDGRVVVIGGRVPAGAPSDAIVELARRGGAVEVRTARVRLAQARAEHTATRLGDDVGAPVLIAGGAGAAGPIATAELWKPLSGELADPLGFAPRMVIPRRGHAARLMPDGSVLIIGGLDGAGAPVRALERYSIDAGFQLAGELPASAGVIDLTATVLPDGRILVVGGRQGPGQPALDSVVIARLDAIGGTVDVVATDRLAVPRARHQAALLCDGTVLVTGGTDAASRPERYNPPALGRR